MRIGLICHLKFPIRRPYSGGLEMFTHALARGLLRRGHDVTLFASGDSDASLPLRPIIGAATVPATRHLGSVRDATIRRHEDAAYGRLMSRLVVGGRRPFDVLHNNSLSPVVLQAAERLPTPLLTTLHVPPLPRLVSALRRRPALRGLDYVNVSHANARHWAGQLSRHPVIHNGTDTSLWHPGRAEDAGSGGPRAVWSGRILPDKGTHLAIEAAHRAGLPIDVAGPVNDEAYFEESVRPRLTPRDRFYGALDHDRLAELVARASVAVVTPCWDEPFGLVVSEAIASGTPVATFRRGGPAEIVDPSVGRTATPGDPRDLARAIGECLTVDRGACRRRAVRQFSLTTMVDRYEAFYEELARRPRRGRATRPLPTRGPAVGTSLASAPLATASAVPRVSSPRTDATAAAK